MNITVLNGSPKGAQSVTLQYVHYMEKYFPDVKFNIINISQTIKKLEKDKKAFDEVISAVRKSHAVIWATPVYFLLVPAQYKRFIELITEHRAASAFAGKYAAVVVTSIHFFDHLARNYLNALCDDLRMKYFGALTPDMYDLMKREHRQKVISFAGDFIAAIKEKSPTLRNYAQVTKKSRAYRGGARKAFIGTAGKKIVVVTDCDDQSTPIGAMVRRFRSCFRDDINVLNISDMDIRGGCTGCCRCGLDNICIHKDNFAEEFDARIKPADIVVFAGTIRERYLSAAWKEFLDRSFYNGHIPSLRGKQFGIMISGPLGQLPDLRQGLEAIVEMQMSNLAGIVTDEEATDSRVNESIDSLARRLIHCAEISYIQPRTFLGEGGARLFRDDIWGRLRFVFQQDHLYLRKNGMYNFPQKDYRMRIRTAIMMLLTSIPFMRKEIKRRLIPEMVKPLQSVVKHK